MLSQVVGISLRFGVVNEITENGPDKSHLLICRG